MKTKHAKNANYNARPVDKTLGVNEREIGWLSRAEPPAYSMFDASEELKRFWFDVLADFKNVRGLGAQDLMIANCLVESQYRVSTHDPSTAKTKTMTIHQAMSNVAKYNRILYDRAAYYEKRFSEQADENARKNKKNMKNNGQPESEPEITPEEIPFNEERGDNLEGFFA